MIGDFHNFDGGKHNVVLGSMAAEERDVTKSFTNIFDSSTSTYTVKELVATRRNTANVENAVMLGYNTDVIRNGGVALGSESIASVDKGIAGYDPTTKAASTDGSPTWKSTAAAISVGDSTGTTVLTRQITNVADGTNDTDAVNVRQLDAKTKASTTELTANGGESAGSTTGNIVLTKTTAADGHIIYDNKLNDKVTLGTDPTKAVTVDGTNGTIKAGKMVML